MTDGQSLFGTWRLVSLKFRFSDSDESADMYGADPMGSLILTPEFQMSTVITSRDRSGAGQAELFGSMMAYSGRFRLEGDQFVTRVEVSWHPDWVGTDQARAYVLDGDSLSILTAQVTHPLYGDRIGRGILRWVRA